MMSAPVDVALVGAGAMGAHHARVVSESSDCRLAVVVDADLGRAEQLAKRYGTRASSDPGDALQARAAIIATATTTHAALGRQFLEAGVPVLIEKPLAGHLDDVKALLAVAAQRSVPLMCGFVERFNPVVVAAAALLEGPLLHAVAIRHSPPAPRIATGVVPDLLIHDLDLVIRLFGVQPSAVAAAGWRPAGGEWDEVVDCTLRFGSQGVATLSVDRVGQRKVRTLSLSTETQLIELDLMRQDLTVYRHIDHELLGQRTGYRAQTVVEIPFVKQAGEPLARQLVHFLALVAGTANVEDERATLLAPHAWATEVEQQCAAATS